MLHQTNIDEKINKLIANTKGDYITQGVSFNKRCPRQINLLRQALSESNSFSGLVKEIFAIRYADEQPKKMTNNTPYIEPETEEKSVLKSNANAWI